MASPRGGGFSDGGWGAIPCARGEAPADCRLVPNGPRHITADLAEPEQLARFVAEAKAIIGDGPVHALVNNAAVSPKTAFKERLGCLNGSLDPWREVFEMNFFAPPALGRGFASPLRTGQWGLRNIPTNSGPRVHTSART